MSGDMADFTLDSMEYWDDANGVEGDFFGNVMYDETTGAFEGPGYSQPKTCRYCGARGLHWESTERGWRLFGDDGMHVCRAGGAA